MPCWRHSLWLHCAVEAGILLRQLVICNQPCQYCYLLVTNALQNFGGQPIIQVGVLWIPHSIEAGLFLSNVCSVAVLLFAKWCILKQFCFVRLFLAPLWALDGVIPCSVHLRLLHCKIFYIFPRPKWLELRRRRGCWEVTRAAVAVEFVGPRSRFQKAASQIPATILKWNRLLTSKGLAGLFSQCLYCLWQNGR